MADGLLFATLRKYSVGTEVFATDWVCTCNFGILLNRTIVFYFDIFSSLSHESLGHDDLIQVLEEKLRRPNQRINAKSEDQIKMQYRWKIQNETDMYKCAVYGIIGCCEVPDHAKVAKTTDDFLWIQLSMIQPDDNGNMSSHNDKIGSDCLTYPALQSMILEKYGEKHFNANEQPHLYFQVRNYQMLRITLFLIGKKNLHTNVLGFGIDWPIRACY